MQDIFWDVGRVRLINTMLTVTDSGYTSRAGFNVHSMGRENILYSNPGPHEVTGNYFTHARKSMTIEYSDIDGGCNAKNRFAQYAMEVKTAHHALSVKFSSKNTGMGLSKLRDIISTCGVSSCASSSICDSFDLRNQVDICSLVGQMNHIGIPGIDITGFLCDYKTIRGFRTSQCIRKS